MAITLKTPQELMLMREAGQVVARAHEAMREAVKPGVSTWELDQIAAQVFAQHGARPAFLGYPPGGKYPFPGTITASINSELVHGIPSKDRILQEGDIISLDTGCHYKGYVGDAAFTWAVGEVSEEAKRLLEVTEKALYIGIDAAQAGNDLSDIGKAIQTFVESHGFSVAREYTGHGVGKKMHEEPSVPNWWPSPREMRWLRKRNMSFRNAALKPGMTIALEPMVAVGSPETEELNDHWTVVMKDGGLSAHFEHSIAIVDNAPLILTLP